MKKLLFFLMFICVKQANSQNCPLTYSVITSDETCLGCCDGKAYVLFFFGGCGAITYSWSTGATTDTIKNLCAGNYSVVVSDAGCCPSSSWGWYCGTNTTQIKSISFFQKIDIYPNPTSDQFYIETNTTDKLTANMYDVNGRHVFSTSVSDKTNIDVTTLNEGIYTLTIKTVDYVINKKLVILR